MRTRTRWPVAVLACLTIGAPLLGTTPAIAKAPISFRAEVMALLSKSGCNAGTCHGNLNGKGGLKLSLRGEDPALDHGVLTRGDKGRRLDLVTPEESLILLKPSMQLAHEGGMRFPKDSPEYRLLSQWIGEGAVDDADSSRMPVSIEVSPSEAIAVPPNDKVPLQVTAVFGDGSRQEITPWAVFESAETNTLVSKLGIVSRNSFGESTVIVRYLGLQASARLAFIPAQPDYVQQSIPQRNFIDEFANARLARLHLKPASIAPDAVYLRRVYLDLIGQIPTEAEARGFAADTAPDKRSQVVDRLLARREFSEFWGQKWADLLRNEEKSLDAKGVQNFYHWIEQSLQHDMPLDEFAARILAARGSTYRDPATNFYRALRDPSARAESAAQVFLGARLQCARCHNHPFDHWTQDDYYSWAACFSAIEYKILQNNRDDELDTHAFDGEQIVSTRGKKGVIHPKHLRTMSPRLLGELAAIPPDRDPLLEMADWIQTTGRRQFARVQVNRVWQALIGVGLVDPVDDFRLTNPAVDSALLEALTDEFLSQDLRLRSMVRLIANSTVYQLASEPADNPFADDSGLSHALIRRLSAEQLLDAMAQVVGTTPKFAGYPRGMRASQLPGIRQSGRRRQSPPKADAFLVLFGKPPRLLTCECERSNESTLAQSLELTSGGLLNDMLADPANALQTWLNPNQDKDALIEGLFWRTLSRPPTETERRAAAALFRDDADLRLALEDLLWGLMNSKEFVLRH